MKSARNKTVVRCLKALAYRLPFFCEVVLLFVGYIFLSPDNCEAVLRFCARMTGLWADGDLACVMPFVKKVVPSLILYWAVMFIFGLFCPLPIRRFWLWIIWGLLGFVCWFLPYPLENLSRYYDAFYASITLVFVAGLIASKLYSISRSGGATAFVLIIFVVIGAVLYEKLASIGVFQFHVERWLRPEQILNSVFGVMEKQKDIAEVASLQNKFIYCFYYFFHALLAFFGGYVIIGFMSKATVNMMLQRFSRAPDSVFWGVSPEAVTLAKSLKRERNEECVFVVSDIKSGESDDLDRLSDEGFLWVLEGYGTLSMISHRVNKHFFITSSGSANVEWATRLSKVVENEPDVYVCIDDETDDSRLFRWANSPDIRANMNVHIIRETSLAADMLLRDHPMLRSPGVKCGNGTAVFESSGDRMAFRLLQIGFGAQGRMLLNRTICDAQAPDTSFSAVVIDANRSAFDLYNVCSQEVCDKYGVRFKRFDVRRKAFYDWLSHELSNNDYTRIVVTTGDDELNLFVADFIVRSYRERGNRLKDLPEILFVRVRHPENYAGFLSCQAGQSKEFNADLFFTPFGSNQEVYSCQSIVDFDIDVIAKNINAYYVGTDDVQSAWREASFFDRESSRGSAMGLRNLCRLVVGSEQLGMEGMEIRNDIFCKVWEDVKRNKNAILDRLADAEHLRWMAYHYVRGVKAWIPERMDSWSPEEAQSDRIVGSLIKDVEDCRNDDAHVLEEKDDFRIKANQREFANCHAALVPTNKLFRIDVYLDIMSFERRHGKIFVLYAKVLRKQWNKAIENGDRFLSASFGDNGMLRALNSCIFAFIDIGKACNSLSVTRVRNEIMDSLTGFAANVVAFMEQDLAIGDSTLGCDSAADKAHLKMPDSDLARLLTRLLESVETSLKGAKWHELVLGRRAYVSFEAFKVRFGKAKLDAKNSSAGFRTLGDLVGKDISIVERVPDLLKAREEVGYEW